MKGVLKQLRGLAAMAAMIVVAVVLSGCAAKKGSSLADGGSSADKYGTGESETGGIGLGTLARVYFDYDKSAITSQGAETLKKNAAKMKGNKKMRVLVEGHTDERGTNEYNISLGEKRAKSVLDYLVSLGIARSRLEMKSWGEEKPLDPSSNESAYSRNRRGEFVILAK
jgi:peptidoglycan-associated lipoprotein